MPQNAGPDVGNLFVGKGVVMFKAAADAFYRYVGNVPQFEFSPSLDTLDHFSSMAGVKSKDQTIVLQKGGTVRLVMEELIASNLAMFLLGTPNLTDPTAPTIDIFGQNLYSGAIKFIGTNEVGPRWTFDFNKVDFVPSGSFNPISDEWGNLEVTGNLATAGGSFGTASRRDLKILTAPVNQGTPYVLGIPKVGQVLTAFEGVWDSRVVAGAQETITYTYQWKADGTNISLATARTYTLTSGEIGKIITVQVSATSAGGGPTAVTSPATAAVLA
jgi:hypothetical protein